MSRAAESPPGDVTEMMDALAQADLADRLAAANAAG